MTPIIGHSGPEIDPVIEIVEPGQENTVSQEMKLAADIGNELARVYPGYFWLVNVNFTGGIATIECGQINSELNSNMTYGYVVHLSSLVDWGSGRKKFLRFAGELLERSFMSRGKWDATFPKKIEGVRDDHQPLAPKVISLDEYSRKMEAVLDLQKESEAVFNQHRDNVSLSMR